MVRNFLLQDVGAADVVLVPQDSSEPGEGQIQLFADLFLRCLLDGLCGGCHPGSIGAGGHFSGSHHDLYLTPA